MDPYFNVKLAQACHECQRALDGVSPHWEDTTPEYKNSLTTFITAVRGGKSAEIVHEAWVVDQLLAGWTPGAMYDATAKTDPDLVHWAQYTPARRVQLQQAATLATFLSGLVPDPNGP